MTKSSSVVKKLGVEVQLVTSGNKAFEVLDFGSSSDEEEAKESNDSDSKVVEVEGQLVVHSGNKALDVVAIDSSSDEVEEETPVIEIYDVSSDDDSEVVFVESSSINVGNNSINRELRRNTSVPDGSKVGPGNTERRLEVEQWQTWLTLEQQVGLGLIIDTPTDSCCFTSGAARLAKKITIYCSTISPTC